MRYSYCCDKCGYKFDEHCSSKHRDVPKKCPECLSPAGRDFAEEIKDSKVDALHKENERWSWSMGANRHEIRELEKQYPGSKYHEHTGQLLIKNRQHKLFEMKRRGMIEYN